jgi:hypothetical protein
LRPGAGKYVSEWRATERAEANHVFELGLAAALHGCSRDQHLELSILDKEMSASRKTEGGREILAADRKDLRLCRRGHCYSSFPYIGALAGRGGALRFTVKPNFTTSSCRAKV